MIADPECQRARHDVEGFVEVGVHVHRRAGVAAGHDLLDQTKLTAGLLPAQADRDRAAENCASGRLVDWLDDGADVK